MAGKIAEFYAEITADASKFNAGMSSVDESLRRTQGNFTGLSQTQLSVLTTMASLAVGAASALQSTVNAAQDYDQTVQQLSLVTGQSAESSSRMIQVMDDLKVSSDALTVAQKKLAGEGLALNIDTLAKLSDQYIAIQDPAEKAAFLTEKFGKQGFQFAMAMSQGGDALRSMNDAVDENLIVTDAAIQASEKYRLALDALDDTKSALAITTGNKLLPFEARALDMANDLIIAHEKEGASLWDYQAVLEFVNMRIAKGREEQMAAKDAINAHADALDGIIPLTDQYGQAINELAVSNEGFLKTLSSVQKVEEDYASTAEKLNKERIAIENKKAKAIAAGWDASSDKIKEYDNALAENSAAAKKNADEHELASHRVVLSLLEQQLSQGGLTDAELNFLLQKGQAWGVYSQKVVDETKKAIAQVNALTAAINTIPTERTFTQFVLVNGSTNAGGIGTIGGGSDNNPTTPWAVGGAFRVPPSYGYEGFNMGGMATASGGETITVTPKGQTNTMGGGWAIDYDRMGAIISLAVRDAVAGIL